MTSDEIQGERRALVATITSAWLMPINTTMIAVALPDIAEDFDVSTGTTGLLITVYLAVGAILQPLAGRAGDRFGYRIVANMALVGFGVTSLLGALAPTFALLLGARILLAVSGASIVPNAQAMLRMLTVPARQGRAFGLVGSGLGVGAAGGPLLGGVLVAILGWRAIFVVNIPLAALAVVLMARVPALPDTHPAASPDTGSAGRRMSFNPALLAACGTQTVVNLSLFIVLLAIPAILEAQGYSSGITGLVLSSLSAWLILLGPIGGRLGDTHGRRRPVVIGMGFVTVGTLALATGGADMALGFLVPALSLCGIGMGISAASITTAAIESVPRERTGSAAGLLSMSRQTGAVSGSVIFNALIGDAASGVGTALAISAAAGAATIVTARLLPGRRGRSAGEPD